MPQNPFTAARTGPTATAPAQNPFTAARTGATAAPADDSSMLPMLVAGAGGAAAIAAAAYALKTGKLDALKGFLKGANATRVQEMLSGLAIPKSVLGNVGGAANMSMETGSWKPLKELFSMETARDVSKAWKAGTPVAAEANYGHTLRFPKFLGGGEVPTPGKVMSTLDTATQNALVRAGTKPGMTTKEVEKVAKEAERMLLQAPIPQRFAKALNSVPAKFAIPFRRQGINQFLEGGETLSTESMKAHPYVLAGQTIAGAGVGAATADERNPVKVGLGTAFAGKYGVPFVAGAIMGRQLMGGKLDRSMAGAIAPVSIDGITRSLTETPWYSMLHPAALRQYFGQKP